MATTETVNGDTDDKIFIGKGIEPAWLTLALANRHGLVTGATGTGKTVSLQVMAEGFAGAGVPVFAADIKGDLSGISQPGEPKDFIAKRAQDMGLKYQPEQFSTVFWDVFGEQGHPIRTTVFRDGAAADLAHAWPQRHPGRRASTSPSSIADDEFGMEQLDFKDQQARSSTRPRRTCAEAAQGLRLCRRTAGDQAMPPRSTATSPPQTVGAVQRQLLVLENQGGAKFFGEPALSI